jgi:hypothetical protein
MFKKKISLKAQQATEKYLTSLGSSREQLTDKQWHIVTKHVKSQRLVRPIVLCCLILGLVLMSITFFYSRWARYEIERVTPNHPIDLTELGDDGTVRVWPQEIKDYLELLSSMSFHTGPAFILGILLLVAVFTVPLMIRKNRKKLEEFIPRKNQQTPSPDNPAPPQD